MRKFVHLSKIFNWAVPQFSFFSNSKVNSSFVYKTYWSFDRLIYLWTKIAIRLNTSKRIVSAKSPILTKYFGFWKGNVENKQYWNNHDGSIRFPEPDQLVDKTMMSCASDSLHSKINHFCPSKPFFHH